MGVVGFIGTRVIQHIIIPKGTEAIELSSGNGVVRLRPDELRKMNLFNLQSKYPDASSFETHLHFRKMAKGGVQISTKEFKVNSHKIKVTA